MILDATVPNLEGLRHKVQNDVTANRGAATIWQNTLLKDVQIEINGVGTYYATRSPADVDRLAQAAIEQGKFILSTNGGLSATKGDERLYETFSDFKKDARLCVYGWDGYKKKFSSNEELDTAWAVYNHAKFPKELLVFGRIEDRLHSGIVKAHQTTSEYFQGGILNADRWNPLVNDCWVLGGIKGGNAFMSVTDFMSLSREVCYLIILSRLCRQYLTVLGRTLSLPVLARKQTLSEMMIRSWTILANRFISS